MEAKFYHVNINTTSGIDTIWSPEVDHWLPDADVRISATPSAGEDVQNCWSPEHLFTAGVSSSIMTTFLALARKEQLSITEFSIKSSGKVERVNGKQKLTELILVPTIGISDDSDLETCERLLDRARKDCPISNFIPLKISMRPFIEVSIPQFI